MSPKTVNILTTARDIYYAIKDDEMIVSEIRCERKSLARNIALNAEYGSQITSASVNGQSFSKTNNVTNHQRFTMLSMVVKMLDNGVANSSKTIPIF